MSVSIVDHDLDMCAGKRLRRLLQCQQAVSRALAADESPRECLARVLETIARGLGWSVGALWQIWPGSDRLRLAGWWADAEDRFEAFAEASRGTEFAPGLGLPGRVWAAGRPDWLVDLGRAGNFPRRAAAERAGLRSGVAVPLMRGSRCTGVLELYSTAERAPDAEVADLLAAIGGQLASFLSLTEAEARFRAVVRSSGDAVVVADAAGDIISWNIGAERIFGWTEKEALGRPLTLIMPARYRAAHQRALEHAASAGALQLGGRTLELTGLRRDETEFPIELTLASWRAGGEVFYGGIARDTSERKRAEAALQRERDFSASLIASLQDGVDVLAADGVPIDVNDALCAMTGFTREELLRAGTQRPYLPDESLPSLRAFREQLGRDGRGEADVELLRKDGTRVPVILTSAPVLDEQGTLIARIETIKDVTDRARAEEVLREREAQLAEAQRLAHVGSWEWEVAADRIRWSDELYRMFGLRPEELPASFEAYLRRIHRDDRARVRRIIGDALATGTSFTFHHRVVLPDGATRILHSRGHVERDGGGEVSRMFGTAQDVTEARRAEKALRRSEELFRVLAENATDMIATGSLDGTIRYVSPSSRALVGFAPEELVGRSCYEFFHPDDVPAIQAHHRGLLTGTEIVTFEYRGLHADGGWVWMEMIARAVRDPTGALREIHTASRDIGLRKRAEEELRRERDLSASLVASLGDGVAVISPDWLLLDVNPALCQMTGFGRDELVGRTAPFPFVPADEASLEVCLQILGSSTAEESDLVLRRRDGSPLPVIVSSAPLRDTAGSVIGHVCALKDITERQAFQRLKDEFVALASHELRTPLTSVLGYLEAVLEDDRDALAPEHRRLLAVAERNARKLVRLAGDLLVVAGSDAGRLRLDLAEVDAVALVDECVESARPTAEERGIALVVRSGDVPPVMGDRARLAQVGDNLLSNALKFTPPLGRVEVSVEACGEGAMIAVADTGMGIDAAELPFVFERFYRSPAASRDGIPGSGLGLAISKSIVEGHGGRIWAESEEGRGSTFMLVVPFAAGPAV